MSGPIVAFIMGDQLDREASIFERLDPERDWVVMAEVREENEHVPTHKVRSALVLSAMRHFRDELRQRGFRVRYVALDDAENTGTLIGELQRASEDLAPSRLLWTMPGDHRVRMALRGFAEGLRDEAGVEFEELEDTHFLTTPEEFAEWASGRKMMLMEHFYRAMRKKLGVLMEGGKPIGGAWNFDAENRGSFGSEGPGMFVPPPPRFEPDACTQEVIALVERELADHVGDTATFNWPVTPEEAREALRAFVAERLPDFGRYQDAMWAGRPFLYHALLSSSLNLKLLHPREVIAAAVQAYHSGAAPIEAVEGFIRQILGWREYVRGCYWLRMPDFAHDNALEANEPLPAFYWHAETEMACLADAIGQTLRYGYAHHIQRLMVTGLYAMLLGVRPREIHEWYLAVYVDAFEWVELPNVIGMSQHADGGWMMTKPYAASGKYIQRMSNYCEGCRYDPAVAVGDTACPFTTLYWDFLDRHREVLGRNNRMALQVKNLQRKSVEERAAIAEAARAHRALRRAEIAEPRD